MREGERRRERTDKPINLDAPSIKENEVVSETIKLCERRCRSTPCNLRSSSGWQQDKRPVDMEDTVRSSPFIKRRQRLIGEPPPFYDEDMEDADFMQEDATETTSTLQQQEAPADQGQGGRRTSSAATADQGQDGRRTSSAATAAQDSVDILVNMQHNALQVSVLDFENVAEPGPTGMSTSSAADLSRTSRIVDQLIDMTTEKLVDLFNRVHILEAASSKMVQQQEEFNLLHMQVQQLEKVNNKMVQQLQEFDQTKVRVEHLEKANSKLVQQVGKLQQADDRIKYLDQSHSELVAKFEEFDHLLDLEKFASDVFQQFGQSMDRLQQLEKFTNDLSA